MVQDSLSGLRLIGKDLVAIYFQKLTLFFMFAVGSDCKIQEITFFIPWLSSEPCSLVCHCASTLLQERQRLAGCREFAALQMHVTWGDPFQFPIRKGRGARGLQLMRWLETEMKEGRRKWRENDFWNLRKILFKEEKKEMESSQFWLPSQHYLPLSCWAWYSVRYLHFWMLSDTNISSHNYLLSLDKRHLLVTVLTHPFALRTLCFVIKKHIFMQLGQEQDSEKAFKNWF